MSEPAKANVAIASVSEAEHAIAEAQHLLPKLSKDAIRNAYAPDFCEWVLPPVHKGFGVRSQRMHRVLDELIQHYHANPDEHDELLSLILSARDPESGQAMTDQQARDFANLDYYQRMALVAEVKETGESSLIGVARYAMLPGDEPGLA